MSKGDRSGCPINLSLELFGDRWTLLILRDAIYVGSRYFGEFLAGQERISSNILANRLAILVENGLLTRQEDPSHKKKIRYSLTETAIELVPVLAQISSWGCRHLPVDNDSAARTAIMDQHGQENWTIFMDELRESHLGPDSRKRSTRRTPSVTEQLNAVGLPRTDADHLGPGVE
jgi:DNA-binding HxlR family transcriptional regulator